MSIGLPLYDAGPELEQALESLLAQTFRDFELIVSDNASNDGTEAVCRAFAARDARIRYVRQPRNLGVLANFHYVLHQARGEYFMWAAHDDLRAPDCVEKLMAALDAAPGAVLASCEFEILCPPTLPPPRKVRDWSAFFRLPRPLQLAGMMLLDEYHSHKAVHIYGLARREALQRAVRAGEGVPALAGWDVCTLLHLLGMGEVVIVPEPLLQYRIQDRSSAFRPPVRRSLRERAALLVRERLAPNARYFEGMRDAVRDAPSIGAVERGLLLLANRTREIARATRILADVAGRRLRFR